MTDIHKRLAARNDRRLIYEGVNPYMEALKVRLEKDHPDYRYVERTK